jgi:hypothetical protein
MELPCKRWGRSATAPSVANYSKKFGKNPIPAQAADRTHATGMPVPDLQSHYYKIMCGVAALFDADLC